MTPSKKTARLAGVLWLMMFIFGPIAQIIRSEIFVTGNVSATANNIVANGFLFRVGFACDLIMMIIYVFLPLVLYKLLSEVNRNLAVIMIILVIIGTSINMVNLLNEFASLYILSGAKYLNEFTLAQLQAQSMLFYDLYLHGYEIANIFFALWLVPLGLLVSKSNFIPKIFGVLLVVGGCCLLLNVFIFFVFTGNEMISTVLLIPQTLAEFLILFWFLIRGINNSKVEKKNLQVM